MLNGNIDPITFEVLSHRLHQITREMGIALERTGGTVTTTQQHDYNASLYRPDGEIMAAGETYGHHVVCAGFAVKRILENFSKEEIFPDDTFLLNDPYLAAIHNPDVYIISPIHYQNALVGWSATFVHVSDVGAITPGGDSPDATEIFQEGFRIAGSARCSRSKRMVRAGWYWRCANSTTRSSSISPAPIPRCEKESICHSTAPSVFASARFFTPSPTICRKIKTC